MSSISVVISAYNEERMLERTLRSVAFADEIIVVDNTSTDKTGEIAKRFTKNVYRKENNLMLNVNKNYGFTKAHSDWILCLDADEVVPDQLALEIKRIISGPTDRIGFWIPRKNIIFGKWIEHGLWWPDKQLRLFVRGKGMYPCKHVHEYIQIDGPAGALSEAYLHYNYESISQFIRKMESIYTENEVANHIAAGYQYNWFDALRFPVSDFVKVYFAQAGYKDGLHGLVLAMLQGFYSFVVFAKIWERQGYTDQELPISRITDELARSGSEISYWSRTAQMNESKDIVHRIWHKILRRYAATI